jgi:flagellar hook protein FlgE
MLDVAGNNIANVNTTGFKSSSTRFEDTLSQTLSSGSEPVQANGGSNPAQVGLGVKVAGISSNFAQGAAQATGKPGDLMITGDGMFIVRDGVKTHYTRSGAFDFDSKGRLVTQSGSIVQGRMATNGVIPPASPIGDLVLPVNQTTAAVATTSVTITGNLPSDLAAGDSIIRDVPVYDGSGVPTNTPLTITKTAAGWDVSDGSGTVAGSLSFNAGIPSGTTTVTIGSVAYDFSKVTGFAKLSTVALDSQNGRAAGTLNAYSIGSDGVVSGTFTNGINEVIGRISLATFPNPGGLVKAGASEFSSSLSSGEPITGAPQDAGLGALASGYLEMSNVDLSAEFTNLIIAQRGFQANARIITTSDQILQELADLKR